jgi:K+-transporting ATPase ATPase C chain
MKEQIRPALTLFVLLTVVTGLLYPGLVTLIGQVVLGHQANGSLIRDASGTVIGSELIGQTWTGDRYFWGRPSATSPNPNNPASSSGSNLGPTNPALLEQIGKRITDMKKAHPDQEGAVPIDLVTASASGLDPHISPAAAEYQAGRVAKSRGLSREDIRKVIADNTEDRTFGTLGEPCVNVSRLNRALDAIPQKP